MTEEKRYNVVTLAKALRYTKKLIRLEHRKIDTLMQMEKALAVQIQKERLRGNHPYKT